MRYCELDSKGERVMPIDYPEILFDEYLVNGEKVYKSKSSKYCFPVVDGKSIDSKDDRRLIKQKIERYKCILRPGVQNWINIEYVLNIICDHIEQVKIFRKSKYAWRYMLWRIWNFPLKYMNLCLIH